jgi:phosphoglycerol transferase MdoB-like AlkP superfamily enzyme
MPNVAALKNQTISFSNYYNHTFATYRGIQGTLYSGHQFDNYDKNNLTSVMDIMRENGYYTAMINTEPNNSEFTSYLNNMGFDAIVTDKAAEYDILDKQAYEMLYDTATAYENNSNPFFLVIYTFGTHASFDAPLDGVVYGDGTSGEINKFYNADYYFGMFFDKFKNSSLKDDTILVFTTDHATYMDDSYKSAFPEYARVATSCDEIPLYIYDNGVTMNVDAQGRNSLDMIPTLLDWMGLNSSTDFLGQSLFTQKQDGITMDTYFWNTGNIFYTGDDTIRAVDENISNLVRERVIKYCAEARK